MVSVVAVPIRMVGTLRMTVKHQQRCQKDRRRHHSHHNDRKVMSYQRNNFLPIFNCLLENRLVFVPVIAIGE